MPIKCYISMAPIRHIYVYSFIIISFPLVDSPNVSTEVCAILFLQYLFSILLMYLIRVLDYYRYCTNTVDSPNISTESSGLLQCLCLFRAHVYPVPMSILCLCPSHAHVYPLPMLMFIPCPCLYLSYPRVYSISIPMFILFPCSSHYYSPLPMFITSPSHIYPIIHAHVYPMPMSPISITTSPCSSHPHPHLPCSWGVWRCLIPNQSDYIQIF
jgi:hypothetical protein